MHAQWLEVPWRARSWSSFSKFWCRRIERIRSSARKEGVMGRGQRTARERLPSTVSAEHRDFTLETQRLGGSGKIGSCDNTFEMTPSPRCRSVFYHSRRSATVPAPRPWLREGSPEVRNPPPCLGSRWPIPPSALSSFFYLLLSNFSLHCQPQC